MKLETALEVKFSLVIFLFHESKNSAVLELRSGHFQGLVGFEAKSKVLEHTFRGHIFRQKEQTQGSEKLFSGISFCIS